MSITTFTPIISRELNGGEQQIFKFANGFGASVIRSQYSYGSDEGLWELAVLAFNAEGDWDITYDTEVTEDVIGHLDWDGVTELLAQISELPVAGAPQ